MSFFTLEGVDGSGKSTQAELLEDYLRGKGEKVILTREPGWGKLGEIIRDAILDRRDIDLEPYAELCLFCADRVHHVRDLILPKLEEGFTVICDRYCDSTVAYQGFGRGLDLDLVSRMAEASTLGVKPDMTFFLSLPVERALSRLKKRPESTKMDEESPDFYAKIDGGYGKLLEQDPSRIKLIDASAAPEDVHRLIVSHLG